VRCNTYISRLCYDVIVHLSVTEVHWRIIANLGFKFRSRFTTYCARSPQCARMWSRCMPGSGEGSSRAMLATARPLCLILCPLWWIICEVELALQCSLQFMFSVLWLVLALTYHRIWTFTWMNLLNILTRYVGWTSPSFCTCCLWPWFGRTLAALGDVICLWFCGWCYVFT